MYIVRERCPAGFFRHEMSDLLLFTAVKFTIFSVVKNLNVTEGRHMRSHNTGWY